jgi:predicted dehydrogenase
MLDAVDAAGVIHQVGFVYRKWPAMTLARELIDAGRLGRPTNFRAHYFHDYARDPQLPATWRFNAARAGAGSVGDIGSHLIDLARYLVGEVRCVIARSRTLVDERPDESIDSDARVGVTVDDATDMLVDFDDDVATGVIQTSWLNTGYKTDLAFEVTGEKGALRFSWQRPNELQFYAQEDQTVAGFRSIVLGPPHSGAHAFWPVAGQGLGWGDAFVISAHDFVRAVSEDSAASPSFADGLRAAEVVAAAQRSAITKQWIEVESAREARPATATRATLRDF